MNKNDWKEWIRMVLGVFGVALGLSAGLIVGAWLCVHVFRLIKFSFSFL